MGGKCTKTFNTSIMVYHLKVKHSSEYADYKKKDDSLKAVKASSSSCSKPVQHSLRSVVAKTRQWDINLLAPERAEKLLFIKLNLKL